MKSPLERIPGVGPSMAKTCQNLGYYTVESLANQDSEELYERTIAFEGQHVDRCVLYVFRCAVYYASHNEHDPEKLKWWNWSDANLALLKTP
jgi:hypothetical protein